MFRLSQVGQVTPVTTSEFIKHKEGWLNNEVDALNSRLDQITKGSISGDAELADIRVKTADSTASSADKAVREQVTASNKIDCEVTNLKE